MKSRTIKTSRRITKVSRKDVRKAIKSTSGSLAESEVCLVCEGKGYIDKCATDPKTDRTWDWEITCPECLGHNS